MFINLVLAGGRKLLREGLSLVLEKQTDLKVVAEAEDVASVPKLLRALPVDVLLLADRPFAPVTAEQIAAIHEAKLDVRVVLLANAPPVQRLQELMEVGIGGCLTEECASTELLTAIRTAHKKQLYLCPSLLHTLMNLHVQSRSKAAAKSLAPREREILRRLADGQVTKEIAADLRIGAKTVETHRRRIMMKLNAYTVAELTKHAIRQGLTTLEPHA